MSKIRVEQIKDLKMWTDEEGVTHIQIGEEVITPLTDICGDICVGEVNVGDNHE